MRLKTIFKHNSAAIYTQTLIKHVYCIVVGNTSHLTAH